MTIGIGFSFEDGVLVGSDMEMTGAGTLKYRGSKDYFAWFDGDGGAMAAVYSGHENEMRAIWEKVEEGIDAAGSPSLGTKGIRHILERSVDQVIGKKKSTFEMLAGISKTKEMAVLLKVFGSRVYPAGRWEVIGYGNCELTHYLIQMFDELGPNTLAQAILWTIHIISIANRFVQSVGQGVRVSVLRGGKLKHFDGDMFLARLSNIELYIARLWSSVCDTKLSEEELKTSVDKLGRKIMEMRSAFPGLIDLTLKETDDQ